MSCVLTQGNTEGCNDQIGGVRTFYIGEHGAFEYTASAGVVTAIAKDSGKRFWKYEFPVATANAKDSLKISNENGTVYDEQTVSFILNRRSAALRNEIMLLAKTRVDIVEVDNNGGAWLYGKENGLVMSTGDSDSGTALGDRNGSNLAFTGMEFEKPLSVTGSLIAALETPGS